MYPCCIAVIKYGYEFGAYELNHMHQNQYPYFITAIKHGNRCFISIIIRMYRNRNRIAFILCLFLFHKNYTIYTYHVSIKTIFNKRYRTNKTQSDLDTFGSDSVYLLIQFTREVKVVQPYCIVYIKHSSFPSLCIGDSQGTVL